MNFRNQSEDTPDINLTPLIDVVFLLLIFFMVSTTFNKESEIQIDLPEASGDKPVKQEFILEISIDSLGRYFINDRRLVDNKLNTLKLAISQTVGPKKKQPHVIINSDKDTPYQYVITAMDAVRQLGLNKFSLTTKQASKDK
jgi:biopolymer transport protein ExbD